MAGRPHGPNRRRGSLSYMVIKNKGACMLLQDWPDEVQALLQDALNLVITGHEESLEQRLLLHQLLATVKPLARAGELRIPLQLLQLFKGLLVDMHVHATNVRGYLLATLPVVPPFPGAKRRKVLRGPLQ